MGTIASVIQNDRPEVKQHRSFSQLKTFLRCPKLYWFQYRSDVLAVEAEFAIQSKYGFPDLIGRIDLVEQDADGRLVVIDVKTASSKSTGDPLYAWQLTLYALSVGRDFKKETVAEVHALIKTKTPQYVVEEVPISKPSIHRAYANVSATCRAIENCDASGEWPCAYGHACRSCAWRDHCFSS